MYALHFNFEASICCVCKILKSMWVCSNLSETCNMNYLHKKIDLLYYKVWIFGSCSLLLPLVSRTVKWDDFQHSFLRVSHSAYCILGKTCLHFFVLNNLQYFSWKIGYQLSFLIGLWNWKTYLVGTGVPCIWSAHQQNLIGMWRYCLLRFLPFWFLRLKYNKILKIPIRKHWSFN